MSEHFDIEAMRDPWGQDSKQYEVVHPITGESFGCMNSHITAENLAAEHNARVVNRWSERLNNTLHKED